MSDMTTIVFGRAPTHIDVDDTSLITPNGTLHVRYRGIGINIIGRDGTHVQVHLSVEETVDVYMDGGLPPWVNQDPSKVIKPSWMQGARISGCRSKIIGWDLYKDRKNPVIGFVLESAKGLETGTIGEPTRESLAYQIMWACLRRDASLRTWMAKNFPAWWHMAEDAFPIHKKKV